MKTTILKIRNIMMCLIMISSISLKAQVTNEKETAGVLNIYTTGVGLSGAQIGNLLRSEVEKLDAYDVVDRFDMEYVIEKDSLNIECNSKLCMIEIGKAINADKMFSGSVELIGDQIVVTLHLIDVKEGKIEKTQVDEFLNLPTEIKNMLNITVREMFGKSVDETLKTSLSKKFSFDNAINNPTVSRMNCSGPRMGVVFITGDAAKIMKAGRSVGGFDAYPILYQFGYQWEVQYLNEGNFQGLFEFVPLIAGLEQGMFVPSLTILNGIRDNKNGWEFAFGPTLTINRKAEGYYDESGAWVLRDNTYNYYDTISDTHTYVTRMDSRGSARFSTGFVFAFGKTIKSGSLNLPLNIFINPNKDGVRFGISLGYNVKKR
jgi:hypothetical protein